MQLNSARFAAPLTLRKLSLEEVRKPLTPSSEPDSGANDAPSPGAGSVAGTPVAGEREELQAQIAIARKQVEEVNAAPSTAAAIEIDAKHGHPSQRLELLLITLGVRFPASASLSFDTAAESKRGPVVIHTAQKKDAAHDPSRVFKAMMKEAAKPARISFPRFIAQQMKSKQCSIEELDPQAVTAHPDFANQHADVQKLANAFLAVPAGSRCIGDVLDRIDNAAKEIERELALATPALALVRKPKKKPDPAARIKAFDDCLTNNGATDVTRESFMNFLKQLLGKKDPTAANLCWTDTSETPGFKKLDFRVQAAFESFLQLTPKERESAAQTIAEEIEAAKAAKASVPGANVNPQALMTLKPERHAKPLNKGPGRNPFSSKLASLSHQLMEEKRLQAWLKTRYSETANMFNMDCVSFLATKPDYVAACAAVRATQEAIRIMRATMDIVPGFLDVHSESELPSQYEDADDLSDSKLGDPAEKVVRGLKDVKILMKKWGPES